MNDSDTDQFFYEELKQEFLEQTAIDLKKILALYKENKFEEIRKIVHDIKGTAGSVGLPEGTDIAEELLFAARERSAEKTKILIDRLKEYMIENGLEI